MADQVEIPGRTRRGLDDAIGLVGHALRRHDHGDHRRHDRVPFAGGESVGECLAGEEPDPLGSEEGAVRVLGSASSPNLATLSGTSPCWSALQGLPVRNIWGYRLWRTPPTVLEPARRRRVRGMADPGPRCRVSRRAAGRIGLAFRGLDEHPGDPALRYRAVLALARTCSTGEAARQFVALDLGSIGTDARMNGPQAGPTFPYQQLRRCNISGSADGCLQPSTSATPPHPQVTAPIKLEQNWQSVP